MKSAIPHAPTSLVAMDAGRNWPIPLGALEAGRRSPFRDVGNS
jgi:hypothetical protein